MEYTRITKSVMERVVRYEKKRISAWFLFFFVTVSLLFGAIGFVSFTAYQQLAEQDTLSLLALFQEDREIIQEYWQEVADTFISEIPPVYLLAGGFITVFCIIFFILTGNKRKRMVKKTTELAKYLKKK